MLRRESGLAEVAHGADFPLNATRLAKSKTATHALAGYPLTDCRLKYAPATSVTSQQCPL